MTDRWKAKIASHSPWKTPQRCPHFHRCEYDYALKQKGIIIDREREKYLTMITGRRSALDSLPSARWRDSSRNRRRGLLLVAATGVASATFGITDRFPPAPANHRSPATPPGPRTTGSRCPRLGKQFPFSPTAAWPIRGRSSTTWFPKAHSCTL